MLQNVHDQLPNSQIEHKLPTQNHIEASACQNPGVLEHLFGGLLCENALGCDRHVFISKLFCTQKDIL